MNKRIFRGLACAGALGMGLWSVGAQAIPILLDSSTQCTAGNQEGGIFVMDVTGNNGGATDCWGTFNGNDPGPSGGGFDIDGMQFDFVAKENTPGLLEGEDIGLDVSPKNGVEVGTWEYDPDLFDPSAFLIVLKAANTPGYGVWLFDGDDAASFKGDWFVAWDADLSHLSIYAKDGGGVPPGQVPEPGALVLLAMGLLGMGLVRRRGRES